MPAVFIIRLDVGKKCLNSGQEEKIRCIQVSSIDLLTLPINFVIFSYYRRGCLPTQIMLDSKLIKIVDSIDRISRSGSPMEKTYTPGGVLG